MEFNEKLQKMRKEQNLTQEELAEKLFVSRTAISKWESGRGYPSIDSLKAIAKYFHITIDELIGNEEIITLAEQDIKEHNKKHTALICGVLDCFVALLLFLPLFGNADSSGASVTVFSLTGVSGWLKIVFIVAIGLTVLNGFCGVVLGSFDKPIWNRRSVVTGLGLSILAVVLFIVTRQPYAGAFCFFVLIIKGILFLESK